VSGVLLSAISATITVSSYELNVKKSEEERKKVKIMEKSCF